MKINKIKTFLYDTFYDFVGTLVMPLWIVVLIFASPIYQYHPEMITSLVAILLISAIASFIYGVYVLINGFLKSNKEDKIGGILTILFVTIPSVLIAYLFLVLK